MSVKSHSVKGQKIIDTLTSYIDTMKIAGKEVRVIRVTEDQYRELMKLDGTNSIKVEMRYRDYKVEVV